MARHSAYLASLLTAYAGFAVGSDVCLDGTCEAGVSLLQHASGSRAAGRGASASPPRRQEAGELGPGECGDNDDCTGGEACIKTETFAAKGICKIPDPIDNPLPPYIIKQSNEELLDRMVYDVDKVKDGPFHVETPPMVILGPMDRPNEEIDEENWPNKVDDTPEARKLEGICQKAFQTSYDCHYIPAEYGGAKCGCFDDSGIQITCPGWYAWMMTGSWFQKPTNTYSVPTGNYAETEKVCLEAFRQAYECTAYPAKQGGPKGICFANACPTWYNSCFGESIEVEAKLTGILKGYND